MVTCGVAASLGDVLASASWLMAFNTLVLDGQSF